MHTVRNLCRSCASEPGPASGHGNAAYDHDVRPFRIEVPDADLADLRDRLARTRWPDPSTVGGWAQGVPLDYARDLCEYWRTRYSWRRCEAELNALPQFCTSLDGGGDDAVDVHFLHVRSPARGRPAAPADPRLAGLGRGVPRRRSTP